MRYLYLFPRADLLAENPILDPVCKNDRQRTTQHDYVVKKCVTEQHFREDVTMD